MSLTKFLTLQRTTQPPNQTHSEKEKEIKLWQNNLRESTALSQCCKLIVNVNKLVVFLKLYKKILPLEIVGGEMWSLGVEEGVRIELNDC